MQVRDNTQHIADHLWMSSSFEHCVFDDGCVQQWWEMAAETPDESYSEHASFSTPESVS